MSPVMTTEKKQSAAAKETATSPESPVRPEARPLRRWSLRRLAHDTEGRVLLAGALLGLLGVGALLIQAVFAPVASQSMVGMTLTHLLLGRAAGISYGYLAGQSHASVVLVNMLIETVMVLIFYPLFVLSWRRLVVWPRLAAYMEKMHVAAEAHRTTIRKYGIPGLLVFVCLPFWMTGPLMGSVIGFLLGLRPWVNLSIVLSGTYIAICGWAVLIRTVGDRLTDLGRYGPVILVGLVIPQQRSGMARGDLLLLD